MCKTIPKGHEPENWGPDHQKWPPLLTLDVTNDFWYPKTRVRILSMDVSDAFAVDNNVEDEDSK